MVYDHKSIEKKWQELWERTSAFVVTEDTGKKKTYLLVEFPYPSAEGLHVGHPRSYTAMDVLARKRRANGENVLYPMGFDAFGLPAENYAIKTGQHPAVITKQNIDNFRRQLKSLGYSFDWSREVVTTDPSYYRWTQWIFLQLYKHNLAYKAKAVINWCPSCKIGLAHEEVVDGKCERCGTQVEQREKEQWMLKITEYADRLLADLETVDYASRIKTQQQNWIGKSEGYTVNFKITDSELKIKVFTTRLDTLFGGTFIVMAPEHPLLENLVTAEQKIAVDDYIGATRSKTELERKAEDKDKTGVFTGSFAINPATNEAIPIWIADFVLMGYGTGIVFADAHDERDFMFAKKYNIPLKTTIKPIDGSDDTEIRKLEICFSEKGVLYDSEEFSGLTSDEAIPKMAKKFGQPSVQYKLRDWVFSRQRYWGEPIPMVYCKNCAATGSASSGWVPVPEKDLPILLPQVEKYEPTDTGESPLAAMRDWVKTTCPKCKGEAERETDTMPNWAGSSWYFLRYCDPHNSKQLASPEKLKYWLCTPNSPSRSTKCEGGVDWYNGGMEHTTLHLLYSRFWHKFLFDIKVVPTSEPYAKRTSHGMVLGEDGQKMSKSRGNVVNPDDVITTYGADTIRVYELFIGPFADAAPWNTQGISGVRRFLDRVWYLALPYENEAERGQTSDTTKRHVAKLIKKVTEDIEAFRFNTAIAAMMEFVNYAYACESAKTPIPLEALKVLLVVLQPFAPHLTAELWERVSKEQVVVWLAPWPRYKEEDIVEDEVVVAVQVNGKLRGTVRLSIGATEEEYIAAAHGNENVARWFLGKTIQKTIVRPGKLVNFVVTE
ncbi:MAG: leucine--tRNA ligase [Patescibacteria group bacterium]|jgi:leucyl-tRNA synthetase